jgi:hypothetical protein
MNGAPVLVPAGPQAARSLLVVGSDEATSSQLAHSWVRACSLPDGLRRLVSPRADFDIASCPRAGVVARAVVRHGTAGGACRALSVRASAWALGNAFLHR